MATRASALSSCMPCPIAIPQVVINLTLSATTTASAADLFLFNTSAPPKWVRAGDTCPTSARVATATGNLLVVGVCHFTLVRVAASAR